MNIKEEPEFFAAAVANTLHNAICVKKKGKSFSELVADQYGHGIIVSPAMPLGEVRDDDGMRRRLIELGEPFVMVRGHGWPHEKRFVWTGTTAEFLATWEGD